MSTTEPTITVPPPVRQPAYDVIYALIRSLGDHMPASPINRNALIWRAVETALDAVGYDELRGEVERLRAERDAMLRLIGDLVDADDCWFDHHGGCQAHGYLALEPGEKCPQQEAKELIEASSGGGQR